MRIPPLPTKKQWKSVLKESRERSIQYYYTMGSTIRRKKNKYKNSITTVDGYSFASRFESELYQELKLRERAKDIKDIQCQVSVYLTDARILYKPDFKYYDCKNDREVYAEAKGFETRDWKIKRRLWIHYGPGVLEIYKKKGRRPYLHETIIPK